MPREIYDFKSLLGQELLLHCEFWGRPIGIHYFLGSTTEANWTCSVRDRKIGKTGKLNSYCLTFSTTSGLNKKLTILKFSELQSDQMELLLVLKEELSITNHITASFSCINILVGSVDLSLIIL